jgi:mersacidin/lichenicidin family type 2 lantibiotic
MSKEEIVRTWKQAGQPANSEQGAPANPAGEVNLSDADLDSVAGGAEVDDGGDTLNCTSEQTVCKGTCAVASIGCCPE